MHDTPGDDVGAGMGTLEESDDAVLPSVAKFTRVCAYDRPDVRTGDDTSTPRAEQPHTVDQDVADLHALLGQVGGGGPYVLVAHSYGGVVALLYTRTYPKSVGGLVMVDAASEHIGEVVSPGALTNWDATNAMTSHEVREGVRVKDAFDKIRAAGSLPRIPTVVLSADKPWRVDLVPPEALQGEQVTFDDWLAAQDSQADALHAAHVTATNSGHDVYLYSPQLVIDAIRDVVDDVR